MIGNSHFNIVLTWTGEVWVLNNFLSPDFFSLLISSVIQNVSHTSLAGWLSGIFNLSKLWVSSSTWGPSSTLNQREIKISSSKFEVILIGCLCHLSFEGYSAVTSIFSSSSSFAYLASIISACFFSTSLSIKTFNLLASGQIIFLSSFDKSLIPFKISFNFQLLPRKSFSNSSSFIS